jgi:hypothetical protein
MGAHFCTFMIIFVSLSLSVFVSATISFGSNLQNLNEHIRLRYPLHLTSLLGEIVIPTGTPTLREETFFEHSKDGPSCFQFETADLLKEKTNRKDNQEICTPNVAAQQIKLRVIW